MEFKIVTDSINEAGVREISYLIPLNFLNGEANYSQIFDKNLLELAHGDSIPGYLFYIEKFPSLITKVRSYKGLLKSTDVISFEEKINSKESYLGFALQLNEFNEGIILDYFFTPNNCCLLKTFNKQIVQELVAKIFEVNFYDNNSAFWIDYNKLVKLVDVGSRIYHFHVNSENERELGIKEYSLE